VVKVEVPGAGDIARGWGPPFYNTETAYFVSLHRNKKSIEIDFKKEAGKELFFRLVERFDVVLENYRVGTLDQLGIAYDRARVCNPGIIYCSVSGFGQTGPYRPILGLEEMLDDPRYATNAARVQNRETLIQKLQEVFLTKTYEEWEALLLAQGIPMGAINTIDQVVNHPQVQARGMIVESEHPVAGTVKIVGVPVKLSETPGSVREPTPLLGQHTDEVLHEYLGMDETEIVPLRQAGVIGIKR